MSDEDGVKIMQPVSLAMREALLHLDTHDFGQNKERNKLKSQKLTGVSNQKSMKVKRLKKDLNNSVPAQSSDHSNSRQLIGDSSKINVKSYKTKNSNKNHGNILKSKVKSKSFSKKSIKDT